MLTLCQKSKHEPQVRSSAGEGDVERPLQLRTHECAHLIWELALALRAAWDEVQAKMANVAARERRLSALIHKGI